VQKLPKSGDGTKIEVAAALLFYAPDIWRAAFPQSLWAEFGDVDVDPKTVRPGEPITMIYEFRKHRDCQAKAVWLFVDQSGSHLQSNRGSVPASINQFEPDSARKFMQVRFPAPTLPPGRYGYMVSIVPDDDCGVTLHPPVVWFTIERAAG